MQSQGDSAGVALPLATVLVVEDEILVRISTARYLRDLGFEIIEAVSAEEAVEVLRAGPRVHAVFADVKLPGNLSGAELAQMVRRDHRQVKVLLTSGVTPFPEIEGVKLLKKPYFLFDVERALKGMLGLGR